MNKKSERPNNYSYFKNSQIQSVAAQFYYKFVLQRRIKGSVTRLGDLLDFGQLFKAFGNN